ncbi:hypothetical protein HaLaN_02716 [Haematococcus lacustris]|uniref:Uncharacterized protein n=1 Tax=Haematococcus lacustris TaxID=44745 RepID=A0A699YLZ9_HAELA|nr:hypothetical protein HaLaN_02716 [Haematococcus lacustris]
MSILRGHFLHKSPSQATRSPSHSHCARAIFVLVNLAIRPKITLFTRSRFREAKKRFADANQKGEYSSR